MPVSSHRAIPGRHLVTMHRSLSTMLDAGLPLYSIFTFLAEQGEHEPLCEACDRISGKLRDGSPLHHAVSLEPHCFSATAVRMLEAGYKGGSLATIVRRLATDQERNWRLRQQLQSQLAYPMWIAGLGLLAVLLLPPIVLADLLQTVVQLTQEPPALTRFLLDFSSILGSPWTLMLLVLLVVGGTLLWRHQGFRAWLDEREPLLWHIPAVGKLWQSVVALRFLRVFAMTYEAGMPATSSLKLASSATGSYRADRAGVSMKRALTEGGSLRESLAAGRILPQLTLEAVEAGEQVGKIPAMMESAANMLESEVESRVEAVSKLVEPLVLALLGGFVGVFALGCLLPIIKLTESL